MAPGLDDLASVTQALFQADVGRLRAISAEEALIRGELAAVDEQERAAFLPAEESTIALRSIQADLNWRGWVARKRETLNLRLAKVLVTKAQAMQVLRKSYGRNSVAELLREQAQAEARCERETRTLAQTQGHGIIKKWSNDQQ